MTTKSPPWRPWADPGATNSREAARVTELRRSMMVLADGRRSKVTARTVVRRAAARNRRASGGPRVKRPRRRWRSDGGAAAARSASGAPGRRTPPLKAAHQQVAVAVGIGVQRRETEHPTVGGQLRR